MGIPLYGLIETPVEGVRREYKKAVSGGFYNGKDQVPSLYFNEGLVTIEPDGTIKEAVGAGTLSIPYVAGESFPFLDQDGNQIGIMTTDQIYQGLACLYLYKAQERDRLAQEAANNETNGEPL